MLAYLASWFEHLASSGARFNPQAAALVFLFIAAALSFPRRRPPSAGNRASKARATPSAKHHCECLCRKCEENTTGAFAMREADGDYSRFLGLVDNDASGQ